MYTFNFLVLVWKFISSFIHLPWLHWSFLHFGPVLGTIFVPNSTKLLLKIRGGGADVCPPGVTMCVHPVSLARRTWIGRTSAGPILILWGGEWWLLFGTYHLWLSFPYILVGFGVQFLSQIHGPKIPYPSNGNSGFLLGLVKLCSLVMENIRFNKNSVC